VRHTAKWPFFLFYSFFAYKKPLSITKNHKPHIYFILIITDITYISQ
jgi:hypothetical protein